MAVEADLRSDTPLLRRIRAGVIGQHWMLPGPFGARPLIYADYTASGRAVDFVEDFVRDHVLPLYANTHTEASTTGRATTRLRESARLLIRECLGGDDDIAVIFCGSGSTAAVDKLVGVLGLRIPAELDEQYALRAAIPPKRRPVVFVGPFEHHSNELPWRESIADVVVVPPDAAGCIDVRCLDELLARYADRPLKIGSFSAASNVTGLLSDIGRVSSVLRRHGALVCWDYAAAGPYVDIDMSGRSTGAPLDAVFLSPHKFVGGPDTPGILAVRRALVRNRVPDVPGGGTVSYVGPNGHRYRPEVEHREEGGTPAIVGSIRAGLVFGLKRAVGPDRIMARERHFLRRALAAWRAEPAIEILGDGDAERLPIVSFLVRGTAGRYVHHNFVVALLDDLLGIQARGGCACAGPYGHRLLGIDAGRSREFERAIAHGGEGIKPGWTRLSFTYLIDEPEVDYLIEGVRLIARDGSRLLPAYRFDPHTGVWQHRGPQPAALDVKGIGYGPDGLSVPVASGGALPDHGLPFCLDRAREALASAPDVGPDDDISGLVAPEFEKLRWFALPAQCLSP